MEMTADGIETSVPERSTFVTVLAWVFIVLSGYMTLMGALQNVMFAHFLPQMGLDAALAPHSAADVRIPSVIRFIFGHMQMMAAVILLLAASTLVASIGLLKRAEWARHVFIGLMALGIVWNVASLIVQQLFVSTMMGVAAPPDFRAQVVVIRVVVFVFSLIWTIALSVLFGWIIRKLRSAPIVAEFTGTRAAFI